MRFVLKRLALFVVALFGLSVVVFAALRILPGDVASVMAGVNSPPERVTQLREQLGLNRPLIAQYFDWMSALARGDFGTSILTGRSVTSLVGARASITFPLIILALLIALAIGLPLGCAAVLGPQRNGACGVSCTGYCRRCRTCVVGRSAADSVVRARRRIA